MPAQTGLTRRLRDTSNRMRIISRLEQAEALDRVVALGQRAARCLRPGRLRDGLHGVWLGHPLHPVLAQGAVGAWLSAPDGPDGRGRPPGWPATQGGFEAAVIRLLND